jgi:hypothetical protein
VVGGWTPDAGMARSPSGAHDDSPQSRGEIVVGASGAVSVHPSTGCHQVGVTRARVPHELEQGLAPVWERITTASPSLSRSLGYGDCRVEAARCADHNTGIGRIAECLT